MPREGEPPAWTFEPRPWGRGDAMALAVWTAAVALIFREAITLRGALFYFDITEINYPYRDFLAAEIRSGRFSRWHPGLYCGLPLYSESQAGYWHPLKYLLYPWMATWKAFNLDTILSVWLAGLGTYGWLRRHVGAAGALAGAAIFGMGGFTWAHLIHTSMTNALISVPLAFWALECTWDGGRLRGVTLGALALAFQVFAGHLQDTLLTGSALGFYGLVRAVQGRGWRSRSFTLGTTVALIGLGVALAAVQWIPSKELLDRSPRAGGLSYENQVYGSWHPELLPTLLVREAYGTRARDTDWMDGFYPYHEMNAYLGVVGLALAVVGVAGYRDRWVGFWVILAGVGGLLMLGKYTFLFDSMRFVPIVGSSRIPVRYHLWVTVAVAALAAVGVDRLSRPGRVSLRGAVALILVLAVASIPFLLYAYAPIWTQPNGWPGAREQDRFGWLAGELTGATARTLILATLAWAFAAAAVRGEGKARRRLAAILPVLALADLVGAHWHETPTVAPAYWEVPPATVARLKADPALGRVLSLTERSSGDPGHASRAIDYASARDTLAWSLAPVWGISSSRGETPIHARRLDDFEKATRAAGGQLDLEGVSHLLTSWPQEGISTRRHEKVGSAYIYRNPGALSRARLVGRPAYADDRASAVAALARTDLRRRLVVEDPDRPLPAEAEASGTAEIVAEIPERVEVATASDAPAYLFLADTFDPGWSATVDGKTVPILPAQVAFRAVFLPAGAHRVVFAYRPAGFGLGLGISAAGLVAAAVLLAWPRRVVAPEPPHGDIGWPGAWPWWFGAILIAVVLASAVAIGPGGRLTLHRRWSESFHRFTWGAGYEAMRAKAARAER